MFAGVIALLALVLAVNGILNGMERKYLRWLPRRRLRT